MSHDYCQQCGYHHEVYCCTPVFPSPERAESLSKDIKQLDSSFQNAMDGADISLTEIAEILHAYAMREKTCRPLERRNLTFGVKSYICSSCHVRDLYADDTFCKHCGAKVQWENDPS